MECVIDIESDSLTPTRVYCIVAKDIHTSEIHKWVEDECYTSFPKFAENVTKFIGHNIISFDAPVLNNLAWCALQLGNDAALDYAQRAVKRSPENARVLDTLGVVLLRSPMVGP